MWPDVCSLQHEIRLLIPGSRVECVDFQGMDLGLQIQKASEATLHITPHGGVAFSLLFSRSGSASIVLVDSSNVRKAKDLYILPNLPWLHVMYLHRTEEHLMHVYIQQAILQASLRLGMPLPAFDFDAAAPFLRRRQAAHFAAEEEAKRVQMAQELQELLLMEAAASQLADDVEQSRGAATTVDFEKNGGSSSGLHLVAYNDATCAVFSSIRILCWGSVNWIAGHGLHISQYSPVPIRTRGTYIRKMHMMHTVSQSSQHHVESFLCGNHVDSLDVSIINSVVNPGVMCIRLEPRDADQIKMDEGPRLHQITFEDVTDIVIGHITCAIMRFSGELQCTGPNQAGQLGDGTFETRFWFCRAHDMDACRVPLPLPITSISAGSLHACAVAQGAVYVDFKYSCTS